MILTADGENSISSHGIELPVESLFKVQLADRLPEDQRGQGETVRVGGGTLPAVYPNLIFSYVHVNRSVGAMIELPGPFIINVSNFE